MTVLDYAWLAILSFTCGVLGGLVAEYIISRRP